MFAKLFGPARKASSTIRPKYRRTRHWQFECLERRDLLSALPLQITAAPLGAGDSATHLSAPIAAAAETDNLSNLSAVSAPSFALTGPASGSFTAGQTVSVQWTDANVSSGSTISLAYDTASNWSNPTWIEIDGVSAASGSGSYHWSTAGLTAGTYYIAGYMYTPSTATAVFSHLTTSFNVAAGVCAPTFALSGPASGSFQAGQTVPIQWTDANVPSGSTISLAYDTTSNWGNPTWIEVDAVAAAGGSGSYSWNTAGLAAGTYYIAGYMYSWSSGTAIFSHLTTSFTVAAGAAAPSFALTSPASGSFTAGQTVPIQWTNANLPSGSTISLAYDTTSNWGNPTWIEVDAVAAANGSGAYSWNTAGLAAGTYYVAGYMYEWSSGTAIFSHLTTSFTVAAQQAPPPPQFTLTPASASEIDVAWNSVSGASGYLVDVLINGAWTQIASLGSGSTGYAATGLGPGTTYSFEVAAYNAAGMAWAPFEIATTLQVAPPPPQFTLTPVSASEIDLAWNSVSGASGYLVNEWINGAWSQIASLGSGSTSYAVTGLSSGTTYSFEVAAYNSAGTAWAPFQNATTLAPNDWFQQNMSDPVLRSLARSDFNRDGAITRSDMLGLFAQAASGSAVSTTDFQDLQAMVSAAGTLNMPDYVANLAYKVLDYVPADDFCGVQLGPGSPSTAFNTVVSDWFYGTGSISASGTIWFGAASGSLFGAAGPLYTDVYQGALGDCTLMAGMAEVAARRPDIISNMFINNGDGTYTVRFYNNGVADYVTVNTVLPDGGELYAHVKNSILWPALLEKAVVEENEDGWLGTLQPHSNSYAALDNGSQNTAEAYLSAISGYPSSGTLSGVASNLGSAWQSGDLMVLCSGNTPDPLYIEHNHCYALLGYNPSAANPYTLFNPWGINGGEDVSGQFYYGEITANMAALDEYFSATSYVYSAVVLGPAAASTATAPTLTRFGSVAAAVSSAAAPSDTSASAIQPGIGAQPHSGLAADRVFAAWGEGRIAPVGHAGVATFSPDAVDNVLADAAMV